MEHKQTEDLKELMASSEQTLKKDNTDKILNVSAHLCSRNIQEFYQVSHEKPAF